MRKLLMVFLFGSVLLFAVPAVLAQSTDPANEANCPSKTGAGGGAEAIPAFVGSGTANFSRNQSLCLPELAPIGTSKGVLAFIVQGVEPGVRVAADGSIYVVSIRGVPGGVDLWRWFETTDGAPNTGITNSGTLPFKYEGQPDNCGIFTFTAGGCANNVGSLTNLGVAPGGGDADIAINAPDSNNMNIPNLPLSSLDLVPGVTVTHSTDRGDNFSAPNVAAAAIPVDDRQWNDAIDTSTAYLTYHDIATFNIEVQRSNDGGLTYVNGFGEAIDPQTFPAAGTVTGSANVAGQIRIDHSPTGNNCPSRGNLYSIFVAPDNATENATGGALRSVYVGVSTDAKLGLPAFMFTDHKVFAGPAGAQNQGAVNLFPALATDDFGFVYAVWSDQTHINFSSSSDQGTTWTAPIAVNSGTTDGKANVFPWVAADALGHVVVVWLGANLAGNSNDPSVMSPTCSAPDTGTNNCWAKWNVYAAESVNGNASSPSFTQSTASDHIIHSGTVSTGGLGGRADRNLADFFQVALDPNHRANISFADDHIISPLCSRRTPGHCASDNDAGAFRVGVPYFTYRTSAIGNINAGTATTNCASGGGGGGGAGGEKITGGGQIPSQTRGLTANFGFVAQNTPANASLSYHDDGATNGPIDVHSSNITTPTFTSSGKCATVSGSAKKNQQPGFTYTVTACDMAEPGAGKDFFSIAVKDLMGNVVYSNGGKITSGNIQIHNQ